MKKGKKNTKVGEPLETYSRTLQVFNSFEEMQNHELNEMASLSSIEILSQLRKLINLSYGMHGYNPDKLPKQHIISNIKYID